MVDRRRSESPFIRPSQLRYAPTLSAPSTVATESSKSTIVVTADSSTTSVMPAASAAPTGWARSITISMPSPWCSSSSADGSCGVAAVADEGVELPQAAARAVGPLGDERPRRRLDGVAHDVGVRAVRERHDVVEEGPHPRDDAGAAGRVVRPGCGQVAHGVGAVQRVVQRAPPGVGRVERVAGVRRRHDELRPGERGDLGVDAGGVDRERLPGRRRGSRSTRGTPGRRRGRGARRARDGANRRSAACSRSRTASSSRCRGANVRTSSASPSQNWSAVTPEPGASSSVTKSMEGRVDPQAAHLDVSGSAHGASLCSRASSSDTRA